MQKDESLQEILNLFPTFKEDVGNHTQTEVARTNRKVTSSIACVLWAPKDFYDDLDSSKNKNKHIYSDLDSVHQVFCSFLSILIGSEYDSFIEKILLCHEHSDISLKCHYHAYIKFKANVPIKTFYYTPADRSYGIIMQNVRSHAGIKAYIMKHGDFKQWPPLLKGKDPTERLLELDLTPIEFISWAKQAIPKDFLSRGDAMVSNFNKYWWNRKQWIKPRYLFPSYLETYIDPLSPHYINDQFFRSFYDGLKIWFDENLVLTPERMLGLYLFSTQRDIGKSYFSKSLVCTHEEIATNDLTNIIYCRTTVDAKAFQIENPKLIIFDDVYVDPKDNTLKEIIKALSAGQSTSIRSLYMNFYFNNPGIPFVFTSNDEFLWEYLTNPVTKRLDPLRESFIFAKTDSYFGPLGMRTTSRLSKQRIFGYIKPKVN